jgi:hypothetical protein
MGSTRMGGGGGLGAVVFIFYLRRGLFGFLAKPGVEQSLGVNDDCILKIWKV